MPRLCAHGSKRNKLNSLNMLIPDPSFLGSDYTLSGDSAWIHVGSVSLLIRQDENGAVVISSYRAGEDDEVSCMVVPQN